MSRSPQVELEQVHAQSDPEKSSAVAATPAQTLSLESSLEPMHTVHKTTADIAQSNPNAGQETLTSSDSAVSMENLFKLGSSPEKNWLFRTYYKGAVSTGFSIPKDSPPSRHPTLMERDTQIEDIADVWSDADKAREQELEHRQRQNFEIPVCAGIPGLGKTRLSQEYPRILERAGLTARKTAGICVRYFNGQSIVSPDKTLDIDVSFAARMLHSAFELEEQTGLSHEEFLEEVESTPSLQRELSIIDVLMAYRAALIEQGFIAKEEDLQVVLAFDEFQSLDDDRLKNLLDLLLNAYMTLDSFGIHLFPVLAGTKWNKIYGLESSKVFLRKIPFNFLGIESARKIALEIYPEGANNKEFLRHLVALSDIPRQVVMYAKDVSKHSRRTDYKYDYPAYLCQRVLSQNSQGAWNELPLSEALCVLAYSISGLSVVGSLPSPLKSTSNNEMMTWKQLADGGLLQLEDEEYPQVPLSLLMRFANIELEDFETAKEKYFVHSIHSLLKLPGQQKDGQRWKQFGAHFLALKINALRLLGYDEVELDRLFPDNPKVKDITVKLLEAKVVQTQHALSAEMDLECIAEHNTIETTHSAFDKNCTKIFLNNNAENGEGGVNYFFALKQTEKNRFMCFLNQKKLGGDSITKPVLNEWTKEALSMAPACGKIDIRWNVVITSPISSLGHDTEPDEVIPDRCVLLSRRSLSKFLGPAKNVAVPFVAININTSSKSKLQSLLGCTKDFAKTIHDQVEKEPFRSFSELEDFFRRYGKDLPNNIKEFVLL